jgi:hypothetical protein
MRFRLAVTGFLALALVSPAAAATKSQAERDAATARNAVTDAFKHGRLDAPSAARYRGSVNRAIALWRNLPGSRATNHAGALHDVAQLAGRYDPPRALTAFTTLDANTGYFGTKTTPAATIDIEDADGVVYRYFPGHGFQFHPLANFSRLNADAVRDDVDATAALAQALIARAVPARTGVTWEYLFPFGGGQPPWTSGMAQAAAAQAFSRVASALGDPTYIDTAAQAFRAAQALSRPLPAGTWVRLYSFSSMAVLNAQLQTSLSVAEYATASGDPAAALFAEQLKSAAAAMLPSFDTGAWSLYALGGGEASLHYHTYVVSLLRRLAQLDDTRTAWGDYATLFDAYVYEPPEVTPVSTVKVVYPLPRDGFRDRASVTFDLSKGASVRLAIAGEGRPTYLSRGRHTLSWDPGTRRPQLYAAKLVATTNGKTAEVPVGPFEVRRDIDAPEITAALAGRRLSWDAVDEGTPWVRLRLRFANGAGQKEVDLGKRALNGSTTVSLPNGSWGATLLAADSSSNTATVLLGVVG